MKWLSDVATKNSRRDLIKQNYDSSQEIGIQHPSGRP